MDLSNKALALVLVAAMAVSLFGTIFSVNRLDNLSPVYVLSGRAVGSDTGSTNFTINSSVSVVFLIDSADFGVGVVNASGAHNCTMNTSSTSYDALDCIGFDNDVPMLVIQNQGTQNVTLNVSFNASATEFIGGTSPGFTFKFNLNESGACSPANQHLTHNSSWTTIAAATQYTLCNSTMFNWIGGARTVNLDLGVRIPQNAPAGARTVVITAYGST